MVISVGAIFASCVPTCLQAHSFNTSYVPPIPLWLYAYGCAATVVVSFGVGGYFVRMTATTPSDSVHQCDRVSYGYNVPPAMIWVLRAAASGAVILTILAGLVGSSDREQSISSALFWGLFLLGLAYLTVIAGNLYEVINPWGWVAARFGRNRSTAYPYRLAYWPALGGYAALIWLELFHTPSPFTLSMILMGYSALTFIGAAVFGKDVWFSQADPFSVYFRLFATLAPVRYEWSTSANVWQVRLRAPLSAAATERPSHLSLVLFVLLLLSSTTYDSIHQTSMWIGLYWSNLLWILRPAYGVDLGEAQRLLMGGYLLYQQIGLVLFPIVYLSVYLALLRLGRALSRNLDAVNELAKCFCYSLLPIAVAYHFSHYLPFLAEEAQRFIRRLAHNSWFNWQFVDTGGNTPAMPMSMIWHIQVGVLLLGHIASVMLSHQVALQRFATRKESLLSQMPLVVLMIMYTVFGLWVLSLPLGSV